MRRPRPRRAAPRPGRPRESPPLPRQATGSSPHLAWRSSAGTARCQAGCAPGRARSRPGRELVMLRAPLPEQTMKPIPTELVFLAAKRTPFGTYGGSLKDQSATDLGVHAAKAAVAQSGVKPDEIDNVVFGNVVQTSADAIYLAR